jgi:hypothetical protein
MLLLVAVLVSLVGCKRRPPMEVEAPSTVLVAWSPEPWDAARTEPWGGMWSLQRAWAEQQLEVSLEGQGRQRLRGALAWDRPGRLRLKLMGGLGIGVLDLAVGPGGWWVDAPIANWYAEGGPDEPPDGGQAPFRADLLARFIAGPADDWVGAPHEDGYALGPPDAPGPLLVLRPGPPARAEVLEGSGVVLVVEGHDFRVAGSGTFPWRLRIQDPNNAAVIDATTHRLRADEDVPGSLFPVELERIGP